MLDNEIIILDAWMQLDRDGNQMNMYTDRNEAITNHPEDNFIQGYMLSAGADMSDFIEEHFDDFYPERSIMDYLLDKHDLIQYVNDMTEQRWSLVHIENGIHKAMIHGPGLNTYALDFDGELMKMKYPGWNTPYATIRCPHCLALSSEFKWNVATMVDFGYPESNHNFTRIQHIEQHEHDTGFTCPQCFRESTSSELNFIPEGYVLLKSIPEIKMYLSDDDVVVYLRFEGAKELLNTNEPFAFATAGARDVLMANYFVKKEDYRGEESGSAAENF